MIETILYRVGILCVLMLMSFFAGIGIGAHIMEQKFQREHTELIQKSRQIEQELIKEQDEVVREYTQKLSDMEQRYAEDIESIKSAQLRDTVPVPDCVQSEPPSNPDKRLPAKAADKPRVACYTENQLRAKIENSLALARECDKEMMRFQALINACQQ